MRRRFLIVSAFAFVLCCLPAVAQEPERELCRDADQGALCPGEDCPCSDDTIEIVFEGQLENSIFEYETYAMEDIVRSRVVVGAVSDQIRGYSMGVAHVTADINPQVGPRGLNLDGGPLMEDPVTASNPARMGGFVALRLIVVAGERQGYILAIVLSFQEPLVLPVGRNVVVNANYQLERDVGTDGTMLTLSDALGDPPTQIVLTVDQLEFPEMVEKDEMNCIDGVDNDFDGFIDRDDTDCVIRTGVSRVPRTVVDAIIRRQEVPCVPTEEPETTCDDGIDNDCDEAIDSADSDCEPPCEPTEDPEATCDDGQDNDCDGMIDLEDPNCVVVGVCPDWAFYFGAAATDAETRVELEESYTISMRNMTDSTGFQLGVRGSGAGPMDLEFTSELGRGAEALVELLIADNARPLPAGHAPEVTNTASAPAIGNAVERGAALAGFPQGSDILLVDQISPGNGQGGEGFTVGYVSDTNDDGTDNLIPATGADGCPVNEILEVTGTAPFSRSDSDGDGNLNLVDAVVIIQYIIMNIPAPFDCDDIFDANDNGKLELGDGLAPLNYLFMRAPPLATPFLACGADTTDDSLKACAESNCR